MRTKEAAERGKAMEIPRARRYGISTTILYRIRGENTWRKGMLKNISTSGLLIAADKPLNEGTNIEMRFTLPVELQGKHAADVSCRGYVVRSESETTPEGEVNIAAKISYSRLIRQPIRK